MWIWTETNRQNSELWILMVNLGLRKGEYGHTRHKHPSKCNNSKSGILQILLKTNDVLVSIRLISNIFLFFHSVSGFHIDFPQFFSISIFLNSIGLELNPYKEHCSYSVIDIVKRPIWNGARQPRKMRKPFYSLTDYTHDRKIVQSRTFWMRTIHIIVKIYRLWQLNTSRKWDWSKC